MATAVVSPDTEIVRVKRVVKTQKTRVPWYTRLWTAGPKRIQKAAKYVGNQTSKAWMWTFGTHPKAKRFGGWMMGLIRKIPAGIRRAVALPLRIGSAALGSVWLGGVLGLLATGVAVVLVARGGIWVAEKYNKRIHKRLIKASRKMKRNKKGKKNKKGKGKKQSVVFIETRVPHVKPKKTKKGKKSKVQKDDEVIRYEKVTTEEVTEVVEDHSKKPMIGGKEVSPDHPDLRGSVTVKHGTVEKEINPILQYSDWGPTVKWQTLLNVEDEQELLTKLFENRHRKDSPIEKAIVACPEETQLGLVERIFDLLDRFGRENEFISEWAGRATVIGAYLNDPDAFFEGSPNASEMAEADAKAGLEKRRAGEEGMGFFHKPGFKAGWLREWNRLAAIHAPTLVNA